MERSSQDAPPGLIEPPATITADGKVTGKGAKDLSESYPSDPTAAGLHLSLPRSILLNHSSNEVAIGSGHNSGLNIGKRMNSSNKLVHLDARVIGDPSPQISAQDVSDEKASCRKKVSIGVTRNLSSPPNLKVSAASSEIKTHSTSILSSSHLSPGESAVLANGVSEKDAPEVPKLMPPHVSSGTLKRTMISITQSSLHSSSASLDLYSKLARRYNRFEGQIKQTRLYSLIMRIFNSISLHIYFLSVAHNFLLSAIIAIVMISKHTEFPTIAFYNILHAILSMLSKTCLMMGIRIAHLISKETTARSLIETQEGLPLAEIAVPSLKISPRQGSWLRKICLASLLVMEACMWNVILVMEWTRVDSLIGYYDCIPAIHGEAPVAPSPLISSKLPTFFNGQSWFAPLEAFGIPLQDGLVGGGAAVPLETPMRLFEMSGPGPVFAFSVACGAPEVAAKESRGNQFAAISMERLNVEENQILATFVARIPANAHDWTLYPNSSLLQICTLRYMIACDGDQVLKHAYKTDEWFIVMNAFVSEVMIRSKDGANIVLSSIEAHPTRRSFDQILETGSFEKNALGSSITADVAQTLALMFKNQGPVEMDGYSLNLLRWGQERGLYGINQTWKGVSGVVGALSHFILGQYGENGAFVEKCAYYGSKGRGYITIPWNAYVVLLTSTGVCFVVHLMQLVGWVYVSSGGDVLTDQVASILGTPLLLLHYFRGSLTRDIQDIESRDHGTSSVKAHLQHVRVKLGIRKDGDKDEGRQVILANPERVTSFADRKTRKQNRGNVYFE
ncbi:hypothetical protein BJ741DRAFT_203812 [Chytriomyces cf. hyalinus JEL632]|nr:hypothetical protein BJ741DRAFT_203812 [Chytriomyces cf. hyalinus JEL632]